MPDNKKLTVLVPQELYESAKKKCRIQFGIGISALVKLFLRAFVNQSGIGFYVGDENLRKLFSRWVIQKSFAKGRKGGTHIFRPTLKDLFDL